MSEILNVPLSSLDSNPYRKLDVYPYNEAKLEALQQSIRDVGLWEGVIGRKSSRRYEIAFGHHRTEAAKRELGESASIPVIIRALDDKQMLQFMGRENMEDYNAEFLLMLETWEASIEFLARPGAPSTEAVEIARLLGWTRKDDNLEGTRTTNIAEACSGAVKLIGGKYLRRKHYRQLSVTAAARISQHVLTRHDQLEKIGKKTNRPAGEIAQAKKQVAEAAVRVADKVRSEDVACNAIRMQIDLETHLGRKDSETESPLFGQFLRELAPKIAKICTTDSLGKALDRIENVLTAGGIDMRDYDALDRINLELKHCSHRVDDHRKVIANPERKITQLIGVTK